MKRGSTGNDGGTKKVSAGTTHVRRPARIAAVDALRDSGRDPLRTAMPPEPCPGTSATAAFPSPVLGAWRHGHLSRVHLPSAKNLQGTLLTSERVGEEVLLGLLLRSRPLAGEGVRSFDLPFWCRYGQSFPFLHVPVWNAMQ